MSGASVTSTGEERRSFGERGQRNFDGPRREGEERRSFGERPARDGERRGFGDRGERKPFDRDRKPFDRDRKPFGERPRREGEERRGFGERPARDGERRGFGDRGERKPFARDRKPFGERPRRDGEGRRSFGERPARDGERRGFGDRGERKPFDRDRKPFGERPRREGEGGRSFGERPARDGERRGFGDRGERKPFDRDRKPFGERPRREGEERRGFGDRDRKFGDRPGRGPRSFDGPRDERPARVPNAADLRSANRPDRDRSPEIDDDVTGQELDRATKNQIKTLESTNASWVAKHLVMAGRLMDIDPELSFQHALAASRRGGRLAVVREAVGLTAYAAGHYGEALREFRTYRRISGSNVHLPVMADCERGLGRPDRALDVVRSPEAQDLDAPGKVELAIVASGARADLGQLDAAVAELEIPQLDINRAFSYSPRLFRAYAEALTAAGRAEEAVRWQRQAVVAEDALGVGQFEEPDIIDLGEDDEEETVKPRFRRDEPAAGEAQAGEEEGAFSEASVREADGTEGDDVDLDDVESDYFESDDAESDRDSVEEDVLEGEGTEDEGTDDAGTEDVGESVEGKHND
ncbi:hypothetical protein [Arthrobacter silvisoli]|uniref:hypothetical protein n=1 Tax=Arthrobacter silvisoli TaxID=2291022 RepID=UPI001FECA8BB|nr:hypothetical protein [Arthrobacter silvisoli]